MFKNFKEWKASYEATKAFGISMGWILTRDPVREPMSSEQRGEMQSRVAQRIKQYRNTQEDIQRKLMGYDE